MGKFRASLVVGIAAVAACGSDSKKTVDAAGTGTDAPPDSKVFLDAAPDAPPAYDFSCFGQPFPTTAPATISAAGTTNSITLQGPAIVGMASVSACPSSSLTCPANGPGKALATTTSAADGTFTLSNVATGGVPLDAYIKALKGTTYRTSYLYPPHPIAASIMGVPVLMLDPTTFATAEQLAGVTDMPGDGAIFVQVVDCMNNTIQGATVTVQQNGMDVGTQFTSAQTMGIVAVFNVPPNATAGGTTVGASYMGMTFPTHNVTSFPSGDTLTNVRPGP